MPTSPIIITGASSGMGKAAALQLAQLGHPLVLLLRDGQKGRDAHAEIVQRSGNRAVELEHADLSSQADIRAAAARITGRHKRLSGFIANAGAHFSDRTLSPDGVEMTLAINHLAPFLLTHLLHDALKAHGSARIVLTASSLQFPFDFSDYNRDRAYDGYRVYGQSKLANVQFTFALARRLEGVGITVNCLAPGLVRTDVYRRTRGAARFLARTVLAPLMASPEKAGQKLVRLATDPALEQTSGVYFKHYRPSRAIPAAYDEAAQEQLWTLSEQLTGTAY